MDVNTVTQLAMVILGPAGAAYVGVRVSLNGTKENVRKLQADVSTLSKDMTEVRERVARIEGRQVGE